ncbi:MAG: bifunctional (p)ppGpp synthetase/guanosine-3',5'-bis(diphosphate) 3'-pyrophosphohydrolase [Oscillospiraceae bacterium]|jgi:GTP pyrophosphokinase|nr:bifunctional (p)ppGpp synthetase/guanosine-3',5'-bis(diphosphate) 3'-pyrophosphohydrolase [Oscillospiraceae bacterium]
MNNTYNDRQYNSYDDLIKLLTESGREYDLPLIEKAYLFAHEAHSGQRRKSGEPYIAHPISVACILVELGMDTECIVAALLHDVVEDTKFVIKDVIDRFGQNIAVLVEGVTKLEKITHDSRSGLTKEETDTENLRKMLFAMNEDIRVIIVKLADRLNNMRTLGALSEAKQREISRETMGIFAPLAHRMGMRTVKEELEDLSLRYLDPVAYNKITELLSEQQIDREVFLEKLKKYVFNEVSQYIPNVQIDGRVKSVNGIYRKMYMQNRDFTEIFDIYAIRIIVESLHDCYIALGLVHSKFVLISSRFKDYINTPKPNGYQSLHTTVLSKEVTQNGRSIPFEIQIRTQEMHYKAEFGLAAHWKYKHGLKGSDSLDEYINWIRKQIENNVDSDQTEFEPPQTDEVYVLTPRGDAKALPRGATVIDFAYAIHTHVGHRMTGAKINGRIVPINSIIHDGDMVEIITTKDNDQGPRRDWLEIVKTGEARNKIRSWFKNERREENIAEGKDRFEHEIKRNRINLPPENIEEFMGSLLYRSKMETVDDFYAAIGYGGISILPLMQKAREEYLRIVKREDAETVTIVSAKTSSDGVVVEGMDDCLTKMSKCCGPMPGDEIIGFITRGHGVSIHKRSCSNVPKDLMNCAEPERWVKASWNRHISVREFMGTMLIKSINRKGLLSDVTTALSNMHIGINNLNSKTTKDGIAIIIVTITVSGKDHFEQIRRKIEKIPDVLTVSRISN